jgi:hypothetical protein
MARQKQVERSLPKEQEEESLKKKTQQPLYDQLKTYDKSAVDLVTGLPTGEQNQLPLESLPEGQKAEEVLKLQQSHGNTYVCRLIERINAQEGLGQPIKHTARSEMEVALRQDFSHVRIHTDAAAATLASELEADAFTSGSDIFFGEGRYQPGSRSGNKLLAHELTHVVQQPGDSTKATRVTRASEPAEIEAEAMSERIIEGRNFSTQPQTALVGAIARQHAPEKGTETESDKSKEDAAKLDELIAKKEEDRKTLMAMWDAMVVSQLNQAAAAISGKPPDLEKAQTVLDSIQTQNIPTAIRICVGLSGDTAWVNAMGVTANECKTLKDVITVSKGGHKELVKIFNVAISNAQSGIFSSGSPARKRTGPAAKGVITI